MACDDAMVRGATACCGILWLTAMQWRHGSRRSATGDLTWFLATPLTAAPTACGDLLWFVVTPRLVEMTGWVWDPARLCAELPLVRHLGGSCARHTAARPDLTQAHFRKGEAFFALARCPLRGARRAHGGPCAGLASGASRVCVRIDPGGDDASMKRRHDWLARATGHSTERYAGACRGGHRCVRYHRTPRSVVGVSRAHA